MTCTKCGKEAETDDEIEKTFPSNGDGKGHYRKQCKECMKKINKEWRKENKEKAAFYNKNRKIQTKISYETENITQKNK